MRLARRELPALAAALVGATLLPGRASAADLRDFGARGDGATDDSAAIQAAIDSGAPVLHVPAGRYLVRRSLVPRSGQAWRGEGAAASVLMLPQEALAAPFNLIHLIGRLEDFSLTDLGLAGNLATQPARGGDGQAPFALYARGAQKRITLRRCHVSGFGEGPADGGRSQTGGGGVVIGPAPDSADQALEDIAILDCSFTGNGNVAGIYLCAGSKPGAARRGVRISGNRFGGVPAGTRAQNCVYVLADNAEVRISGVSIQDNRFEIEAAIDALVELNWVEGFAISGNQMIFDGGLPGSSAILLRDGCRAGTVAGNVLVERSGADRIGGILLLNFANPGRVEEIAVSDNVLTGFRWRAIAADRGSRGVTISGNRIAGAGEAVRVADAQDVHVTGNSVADSRHPVLIAAATSRDVTVSGNHFIRCGGAGGLVQLGDPGIAGLSVGGNRASGSRDGTSALVAGPIAADARIAGNELAGLKAVADER